MRVKQQKWGDHGKIGSKNRKMGGVIRAASAIARLLWAAKLQSARAPITHAMSLRNLYTQMNSF